MSDPQTFEELRRMARKLPKNVLVPAHHIHSLLDETERLVERITDLKRQLAEAKADARNWKAEEETAMTTDSVIFDKPEVLLRDKCERLEKQLAERDVALARLAPKCGECYGTGNVDDAEPGDISFNTFVCPKCGGSGKDLSSLPTSAQATANVLAAARRLVERGFSYTSDFRDLEEAIREEQETK